MYRAIRGTGESPGRCRLNRHCPARDTRNASESGGALCVAEDVWTGAGVITRIGSLFLNFLLCLFLTKDATLGLVFG